MAIDVSRELERELKQRVRSGDYSSAEELLRDALRLVDERERLRQAIAEGGEAADRGEFVDGESVIDEVRQRIRVRQSAGG